MEKVGEREYCARTPRTLVAAGLLAALCAVGCDDGKERNPRPQDIAANNSSAATSTEQPQQPGPIKVLGVGIEICVPG